MRSFVAVLVITLLPSSAAPQSCPSERLRPDFGYKFISCVDCLTVTQIEGRRYTRFRGEPVLHQIREDGPGAGRLLDRDTLVSVDDQPSTSREAAMLLGAWRREPVRFVVRRNGVERAVAITAEPVCDDDRVFASPGTLPGAGKLGVGIDCVGCRLETSGGRDRWSYSTPPALARVMPGGPAARAGLREGDTLLAVDGHPISSRIGSGRLASVVPRRSVALTIRRGGQTLVIDVVPEQDSTLRPRLTSPTREQWRVGDVVIEATGKGVKGVRDPVTGTLKVTGDSVTVTVRPPVPPRGYVPRPRSGARGARPAR